MVEVEVSAQCAACGTDVSQDRWSAGLCPACLIELALDDTALEGDFEPGESGVERNPAPGWAEVPES